MAPPKSLLLTLLPLLPQVSAWGTLGHDTVAFIAQSFICNKTRAFAQNLLNDSSSSYLANVATWADTYRYTAEGSFSAPLHYIDALDNPPTSCNVDYERDCPEEGCIVSAIANYTVRVKTASLPLIERQKALKWIIHFLGDIHQPLHVENLEIGGNTIAVSFNGTSTNLHHIWDSNMPEKLIGGYALEDARNWAASLSTEITSGKYKSAAKGWLDGIDGADGVKSAMVWATDANARVCDVVVPEGAESVRGQELDGAYYDAAIPVIQLQIAKAGYRLAAWLSLIATGEVKMQKKHFGRMVARNGEDVMVREVRESQGLEEWMVEARRVRRAFGWNCGAEGHKH
ncbi:hypothetical protein K505DRAFT_333332 [Melanomma pulvis-pyrius CBS 109.77]|uniref:Nuclease PA3 n=1 Tax=Melanomma pulvis-pyrius CBS 109.77 TaxID=1314802 RepID=A0A6A6XQ63_9PLEO|nr:hypothetical protein K505DRAFT_333332 [Melanomma pulvis-pyrius CBS 109.77]